MALIKRMLFVQKLKKFSTFRDFPALKLSDPEIYSLVQKEQIRQKTSINLIASENFVSTAALESLATCLSNKYSEGQIGARYFSGTEFIDRIEALCKKRALAAFGLSPAQWGVNVQSKSGSTANLSALLGLLPNHGKLMGLGLASGGHLTHGHFSRSREVSVTARFFSSLPYDLDAKTGRVDEAQFEADAKRFCPKLIIVGGSAYPRDWNYAFFSRVAKEIGATLLADISHPSGLIAAKCLNDPFEFADVVTTTTHKTLSGPRGALIFYRPEFKDQIDWSVFPHVNGGPHNNNIAGIATQLLAVNSPQFKQYAADVIANAKALARALSERGFELVSGGTDSHLILVDLRKTGVSGALFEKLCEAANVTVNKNSIFGDAKPGSPAGARLGTPALTSRGLLAADFEVVAEFLERLLRLAQRLKAEQGGGKSDAGLIGMVSEQSIPGLAEVKSEVIEFASAFKAPGIDV